MGDSNAHDGQTARQPRCKRLQTACKSVRILLADGGSTAAPESAQNAIQTVSRRVPIEQCLCEMAGETSKDAAQTRQTSAARQFRLDGPQFPLGGAQIAPSSLILHGATKEHCGDVEKAPAEIDHRHNKQELRHHAPSCRSSMAEDADQAGSEEQNRAAWLAYEQAEGWQRRIAETRLIVLMRMFGLRQSGLSLRMAREAEAARCTALGLKGCGVPAIQRWARAVRGRPFGEWLVCLLPGAEKPHAPRVNRRGGHERA